MKVPPMTEYEVREMRHVFAGQAMQGIVTGFVSRRGEEPDSKQIALDSVELADALIAALRRQSARLSPREGSGE